ncbi:MAG: hypothetical protein ACKOOD_02710, partial [Microbacteriaceae bacterium]
MPKFTRRWIAAALAMALSGTLLAAEPVLAQYACAPGSQLSSATSKTTQNLGLAVKLNRYDFEAGKANASTLPTRVTWAQGNLNIINFVAVSAPVGETASQYQMAQSASALAWVNTDFYDEWNRYPYSAMIHGGKLLYAPNRSTDVVASAEIPYQVATGYPGTSYLRSGKVSILVSGVNNGSLSQASGATLFTPVASSKLPKNQYALLIAGGKVKQRFTTGSTTKPRYGMLILANGLHATKLKALNVGDSVSFAVPKMPASHTVMVSDHVWAYGLVQAGQVAIRIRTVNSNALNPVDANLYDSNFSVSKVTLQGRYTLVLNSAGVLTAKYWGGRALAVPAGGTVVQLGSAGLDLYKAAVVGQSVTVKNEFKSRSGLALLEASGRGANLLAAGKVVSVCYPRIEEIRPRTAVAWNNATNQIWLMTTSSG